jgi:hypothetical protein
MCHQSPEGNMSVTPASDKSQMGRGAVPAPDYYAHDERGHGWVMFAGVPTMLLGTINFIEERAAA